MVEKIAIARGTSDIFPEDAPLWQEIETKARNILNIYSYREIRTPIFEDVSLFKRSLGQTSDVVNKQLLELASGKEEKFVLRPEGTASIVRSYIENDLDKKENLSKFYYIGPMFRGERPQKGRLRQFHQIGVEAIGPDSASPFLDAEVIALSVNLLKSLGVSSYRLKINTLGSVEDKTNFSNLLRAKLNSQISKLCEECQVRFERNIFRVLDCKNRDCQEIVKGLSLDHSFLSIESNKYYAQVKEALTLLGVKFEENLNLVRGLDYYTHTVFEISSNSLGSQDALCAGGRYNNLVSDLGGSKVDAVGFALGIERVILSLDNTQVPPQPKPNVFIVALDEASYKTAFSILNTLREGQIASEINYRIASIKSLMRLADKSGAPFVIIIGENEIKKQVVTLKDMNQKTQEEISISNSDYNLLVEKLKERLNKV